MNEIIVKTVSYIELITGEKVTIKPLDIKLRERVPMYLLGAYDLFEGVLFDKRLCFALVNKEADTTPAQYSKRAQALSLATGLLPVFLMVNVASYNLQRLTNKRVNFIVPGKQLFLPALLMDLGKNVEDVPMPETIPATAQLVILYHLEVAVLNGKTGKEIAAITGASTASVTRALRWLVEKGLAELNGGKPKYLRFNFGGKALWSTTLGFLKSPVLRIVRTDMNLKGLTCGQNALAEYGMLIEADHEMVAMGPKEYRAIKQDTNPLYGENEIQVWMYDPQILATNMMVDKLSLYLSMRDSDDERIQKELKTMIEEIIWLED